MDKNKFKSEREHYEGVMIGVMFDKEYNFEDVVFLGISHSPMESHAIENYEIMRLYEDFVNEDSKEHAAVEVSYERSAYDEPITVIKYASGYEHIYLFFEEDQNG